MNTENLAQIQTVAIIMSVVFLLLILYLIRNKRIKEEYSLLWIFFSVLFIVFSIWRDGLDYVATSIGIAYPPAALFLILLMAVFLILIEFSIIISKLTDRNKTIAQEIGLMKLEMGKMKKKILQEQTGQANPDIQESIS